MTSLPTLPDLRVAVVHDWLYTYAGAERVLEQFLTLFPQAEVFTLINFLPPGETAFLQGRPVHTSFLQKMPGVRRNHRPYLPLMPVAVEQFDLSGFDLVLSSSYAVAKGAITGPDQKHVSYVHSPARYAWDLQHFYLRQSNLTSGPRAWFARQMLHYIRMWDARTANGVDAFLANSQFIARRIWKTYRRPAQVIYPPVDTARFQLSADKDDYYFTASRMVPYKKIDLIVEAFSRMPDKRLVVVGDGPEMPKVRAKAGLNVHLLGYQPTDVLVRHMQHARAFVFAAEEDFGILPVEAQACGTPVIAFGKGGVLESVRGLTSDRPTGAFFPQQTVEDLIDAVRAFEAERDRIVPAVCRENALRFNPQRFRREIAEAVAQALEDRSEPFQQPRPGEAEGWPRAVQG